MNRQLIKMLKGLATAMVVASILFAFLISGVRILGFDVFGVLTGSMEPAYPVGSLIYVKPVDASELRVNDVITFSVTPGVIATHRIVEVVPDENNPLVVRYRTKGDANNDVDAALVSAGNIVGKVMFCIPALGQVASYIQEPPGLYVAILVCVLMIAFVFFTDSLDEKQRKSRKKKKGGFDWANIVNPVSEAILGRPLIRRKRVRKKPQEDSFRADDRRPRTQQAPRAQQARQEADAQPYYPQQAAYPHQGGNPQYPQQGRYPQQPYQRPAQQPYYPQQPYQRPAQQPYYPQQGQYPQQPYQRAAQQTQRAAQQPYYPQQGQYPQQPYQRAAQQPYQPQQTQRPAQQPYYPQQGQYPQQPYQRAAQQPYQPQQAQRPAQQPQQPAAQHRRQAQQPERKGQ